MKRGRVKHTSVMGEGSFCKVYKGELVDDQGNPSMNIVIKALSEDATIMEKDTFHRETSLLCPLQHVNILGLLGVSPSEDSVFVVFEYLSETNLHQFLKLKSPQNDGDENKSLAVDVLFDIAAQIANGMKYLAEFNYIHGDLAARNCFISENEINVKISMLGVGIGSHKYPSDYGSLHQGNSLFPIRWMSPESLESLVLTSENDIWAFGVLLWEIFSFGLRPYHQYSNTEVTDKVRALELLACPQDWPNSVRNVIGDCWSVEPSMRPNFETIYDTLSNRYFISLDKAVEVTV